MLMAAWTGGPADIYSHTVGGHNDGETVAGARHI